MERRYLQVSATNAVAPPYTCCVTDDLIFYFVHQSLAVLDDWPQSKILLCKMDSPSVWFASQRLEDE